MGDPLPIIPVTLQDVFNAAWQEFIVNGKPPSISKGNNTFLCKYRSPTGGKCVVGLIIPDDLYRSEIENRGIHELKEFYSFPNVSLYDLREAQVLLHDWMVESKSGQWISTYNLKSVYEKFAQDHGLSIP